MAPKPLQRLGSVKPHGNGWRAVVHLAHGDERGPVRTSRCRADGDLARMRGASSRVDIPRIARAIRESALELAAAQRPLPADVATSDEQAGAAAQALDIESAADPLLSEQPHTSLLRQSAAATSTATHSMVHKQMAPEEESHHDHRRCHLLLSSLLLSRVSMLVRRRHREYSSAGSASTTNSKRKEPAGSHSATSGTEKTERRCKYLLAMAPVPAQPAGQIIPPAADIKLTRLQPIMRRKETKSKGAITMSARLAGPRSAIAKGRRISLAPGGQSIIACFQRQAAAGSCAASSDGPLRPPSHCEGRGSPPMPQRPPSTLDAGLRRAGETQ